MSLQNTTKAMLSLAFRTNFKNLPALISKTEALNNLPFITLKRTICTSRILKSRGARRSLSFNEFNVHEEFIAKKDPKDFGKTVVLNSDEVEAVDEDMNYGSSKKLRSKKKEKDFNFGEKRTEKIDELVPGNFDEVGDVNDCAFDGDEDEPIIEKFKQSKPKKNREKVKFEKRLKQSLQTDSLDDNDHNDSDDKPQIEFQKLRHNSALLCSTLSDLKMGKKRKKLNKVLIEGRKLIHEAIAAGCQAEMIFFTRINDLKNLNLQQSTKLFRVSYKDIQLWSDVDTSQGIIAVFTTPNLSFKKNNPQSLPLTVICDNIRDPGNMGSILRVATSVGCQKIILTKGCVDIWGLKVTRAAAGAHFRLPVLESLTWPEIANAVLEDSKIILATNRIETSQDENDNQLPSFSYLSQNYCNGDVVIVIGNEAHGISKEGYQFAAERKGVRVYIPMSNDIESLNSGVAFAILSYEVRRQIENSTKDESQVENCEKESSSVQSN